MKNVGKIFAVHRRDHNDNGVDVRLESLLDQNEDSLRAMPADRSTADNGMGVRRSQAPVTHRLQDAIQIEHREERGGQRLGGGEELLPTYEASDPTYEASDHERAGWLCGHKRAPARMTRQG